MEKKCTKCKEVKDIKSFNKRVASRDSLTSQCRTCINTKALKIRSVDKLATRGYNLKRRFNMTINEYNIIYLKQRGMCRICDKPESSVGKDGKIKYLCVDHCHSTGNIRGLLCSNCNTGLGLLGDSKSNLKNAIKYLEKEGQYGK